MGIPRALQPVPRVIRQRFTRGKRRFTPEPAPDRMRQLETMYETTMRLLTLPSLILLSVGPALAQQTELHAKGGNGAIGTIPCTASRSLSLQDCPFGAQKSEDGLLTIRVILPGGTTRIFYFRDGVLDSSNATSEVTVGPAGDWTIITVSPEEHFEIPTRAFSADAPSQ